MATIALSANRINQMPSMIRQVKQSVAEYKNELFTLKQKSLTVNQSICNLNDVVDAIQASTKTQEDKIDSLETLLRESEEFISDVVHIDDKAAAEINRRKDEFYEAYYYLKPECEKSWTDKAKDVLVSVTEWCKENWKLALTVVIVATLGVLSVVTGGILATILAGAFWAALAGAAIGGMIGGLTSLFSGGSFLAGFGEGALSGAITGALMGALGAGGAVVGKLTGKTQSRPACQRSV